MIEASISIAFILGIVVGMLYAPKKIDNHITVKVCQEPTDEDVKKWLDARGYTPMPKGLDYMAPAPRQDKKL